MLLDSLVCDSQQRGGQVNDMDFGQAFDTVVEELQVGTRPTTHVDPDRLCGLVDGVPQFLASLQQTFAKNPPEGRSGTILDGRDIATVVCPEADFKIFVNSL